MKYLISLWMILIVSLGAALLPASLLAGTDCDPDQDNYLTEGGVCGGDDCAPLNPFINPGAGDIPNNGIDEDCDGFDDQDLDGDGHVWVGHGGGDCDDADPNRYPGNIEVCDAEDHDEDCDFTTFGVRDVDGDGHVDWQCCNFDSGTPYCGRDCDDMDPQAYFGAIEVCDGKDNNCDATVDVGLKVQAYLDADEDGWGDIADNGILLCPKDLLANKNRSGVQGDCADYAPSIHPGAIEACNGLDDNCNGVGDEGLTGACD